MVLNELFGRHAPQVAKLRLHHNWHQTQRLFDYAFRNPIDGPADISLRVIQTCQYCES